MKQIQQTQHPRASQNMRIFFSTLFFLTFFASDSWSQVAGDFRSLVSGNWNNPSSWERFTGTIWEGSGVGANNPGQIPSILNSVFIQSGHTISLDASAICNSITIDGGATLNANSFSLNVFTDWNNNGTFNAGTSTVNLVGDDQLIGGSSITSFNYLAIATTITAALTSSIIVLGDLSTTSTGSFKSETFNITVNGLTTAGGASSIKDAGAGIKQYNGGIVINGGSFVSTVPVSIPSTGQLTVILGNLTLNAGTGTFSVAAGAPVNISGGNITIGAAQTLSLNNTVNMTGGSINGNGALVINSTFNMNGGTLAGAGTSTVSSPNVMNIAGTSIILSRSITVPIVNWQSGDITIGSGSILSATSVNVTSSGTISGNGTLAVTGVGASFVKSSNVVSTINSVLSISNPATMTLSAGTLALGGGATFTGPIALSNNATIQFNTGTYALNSPASLTGTGSLVVNGGNVTCNVAIGLDNISAINVSGGTLTLNSASTLLPPVTLSAGTMAVPSATTFSGILTINGGTMTTTGPVAIASSSAFIMQSGVLNINAGSGVFNVLSGTSANISGGTINIAASQIMNFASGTNMSGGVFSNAGTITSNSPFTISAGSLNGFGSAVFSAPGVLTINGSIGLSNILNANTTMNWTAGNIAMSGAGAININSGVTATFSSSGSITSGGGGGGGGGGGTPTVNVSGVGALLQKTGTLTTTINAICNITSPASLNIISGTLALGGGGTMTGAISIATSSAMQFNAGTSVFSTPASVTGTGNMIVNGATVNMNVAVGLESISNVAVNTGTFNLGIASTLNASVNINGGTFLMSAPTTIANQLVINGGTMTSTAPVTFGNSSSLSMQTGNINVNGGSTNVSVPASVTTTINGGTISIASGQAMNLAGPVNMSGGAVNGVGSLVITNLFTMSGGSMSGNGVTSISSPGAMNVTGTISINRSLTTTLLNWTAGNISVTSGTINVSGAFNASSTGTVTGSGSISASSLLKTGTGTTTSSSQLIIGSGGSSITAGTFVFGQNSSVAGNVSIAQNAKVQIINGKIVTAQTLTLGGHGAVSGTWGSNSSSASNKNDTYFVLGTTGVVSVSTNTCVVPVAGITSSTTVLTCVSNSITLNANGSGFYSWDNSSASSSRIITTVGTYSLTVSSNGCGSSNATITITIDTTTPNVSAITGSFTKTCNSNAAGNLIGETNVAGYTYAWTPTAGLNNASVSNPLANPSETTTYIVTKTKTSSGCSSTSSVLVNVNTVVPIVSAGTPFIKTCVSNVNGSSIGEINDATATYAWTPITGLSAATISNPIADPSSTTTYTVTKTNIVNGCSSSANIIATVNTTAPAVSAGNSFTKTCVLNSEGTSIGELNDVSATYLWSPVEGLSSSVIGNPIANPNNTTTYTVTKTSVVNGCSASANVTATVNITAPVTIINASSNSICNGTAVVLTATGADTYVWNGLNQTSSVLTVTPVTTTTYSVTGTNSFNGCTSLSTSNIVVNELPQLTSSTNSAIICEGSSTTVTSTGADTYIWSPGNLNGNSNLLSPAASTTYTITGTNTSTGCSNTTTQLITVNPLPNVAINAGAVSICNGNSTSLTATGANSYVWQPGAASTATMNVTPLSSTVYTVTGTSTFGCVNTATKLITVNNCNLTLNIKLFIEGYYNGGGLMAPVRANQGIGNSSVNVDFITIELHNSVSPFATVASSIVFLKTNGTATATFTNVIPSSYYIVIKHRNAIKTWSALPITTSLITNYDFTTSANQAYGDNMTEVEPGVWAFYSGDISADDNIDLLDLTVMENDINEFAFGFIETDVNGDGNVDLLDSPIVENNVSLFIFSNHP